MRLGRDKKDIMAKNCWELKKGSSSQDLKEHTVLQARGRKMNIFINMRQCKCITSKMKREILKALERTEVRHTCS